MKRWRTGRILRRLGWEIAITPGCAAHAKPGMEIDVYDGDEKLGTALIVGVIDGDPPRVRLARMVNEFLQRRGYFVVTAWGGYDPGALVPCLLGPGWNSDEQLFRVLSETTFEKSREMLAEVGIEHPEDEPGLRYYRVTCE